MAREMSAGQHQSDGRFRELDGLRGIAAMWVVIYHYCSRVDGYWLKHDATLASQITPLDLNLQGLYAVHLFFIISGFVIFMTIRRCRTVADFGVSRGARLYPAYWISVMLAATVAIALPAAPQHVTLAQAFENLTMLNLYYRVQAVDPVYWSLAYELGFYMLIALAFALGLLTRIEILGAIWIAASLVLLKLFPQIGNLVPWRVQTALALPYASLFFAGILFYKAWTDGFTPARSVLIVLCYLETIFKTRPLVAAIMTAIFLLVTLAVAGYARWLASPPLVFLGTISYSLYVVHGTLGWRVQLLLHRLGVGPWSNLAVTTASAVGVASAVTFLVERPANRAIRAAYKKRLTRAPATLEGAGADST
jgi:peptidoglycan/LPS O-acetylase OafA/YrhL